MIEGFNQSYHGIEVRSAFMQRMVSLFLTMMLAIIMITSIAIIFLAEFASSYLVSIDVIQSGPRIWLMKTGTWIILVTMSLLMISCLYYFGPSKKNKRPFISVGSVTATILLILTTLIFNYFIGNFSTYNKIYGSIGTLIIILLWINFNSLQLIIGFELNASIENAIKKAGKYKVKTSGGGRIYHKSALRINKFKYIAVYDPDSLPLSKLINLFDYIIINSGVPFPVR
jgi:membrane protein